MKISVLGQGAMGSRMAARLIAAGHQVTIWNRTPRMQSGATVANTVAAAVAQAGVVITMLRDDAASAEVWQTAMVAMAPDAIAIEASTISVGQAQVLHARAARHRLAFLDAPVAGSRPQAEAGQLIFMVGGDPATLAQVDKVLRTLGCAVHHAGGPGSGAMAKLMINSLFGTQLALMAELIGMAVNAGMDPARATAIIGATPVASPALKGAAAAMLEGNFAAAFPIDLVAKDFALVLETGHAMGADMPVTAAVHGVYVAARDAGYGDDNITGVIQSYVRR